MTDELNRPLGLDREPASRFDRPVAWLRVAFAGLALVGLSLVAFVLVTGDRNGGEPFAIAQIQDEKLPVAAAAPAQNALAQKEPAQKEPANVVTLPNGQTSAADIERSSGVKVVRPGGFESPGALIIRVPNASSVRLMPAPDPRLIEKSRHGMLPRIAADGTRPADLYARPVVTSPKLKPNAPRVAIVVGGMGVSRTATQDAIDKLPGAITLAFAPYGADVEAQAARARDAGHEIVLQLPMEPFGSGGDDPGPHTLRTDRAPEAIVEDLHWLMARFPGYVGLTNFLGGRFTSEEAALAPVLREAKDRGLIYIDDATSPRSVAGMLANRSALAFARANIVLDADPSPDAVDAALVRLEAEARKSGLAIGSAGGLPISVERIARFARTLEERGIALVPASAAASTTARPSADAKDR